MSSEEQVQELSFQFAQFTISVQVTVRPRDLAASVGSDFSLVDSGTAGYSAATAIGVDLFGLSRATEDRVLAATEPGELARLNLPCIQPYLTRLRGSDPVWTPAARLGRALRAGIAAGRRYEGEYCEISSPGLPFRNSIYIILRSARLPEGGWTTDYGLFSRISGLAAGGEFPSDVVCQAFATRTEAEVFVGGARRPWPQQIQS